MSSNHLIVASLLLAGCGPLVTEPMPDIPETVEYDTVRIEYGDDDLVTDGQSLTPLPAGLVGDPSVVASLSRGVVAGTNTLIRDQFRLIEGITKLTPASWDNGLWVWDNAAIKRADEQYSQFRIEEDADGELRYEWLVGNAPGELLEFFSGSFTPRDRVGGSQRGSGIVRFHFDNVHAVDPEAQVPRGRAAIAFRAVGNVRQVRVATYDFIEVGGTEPQSSLFEYVQLPERQGRFKFGTRVDFLRDGDPHELLAIDAAWTAAGEGRARARLSGGSLAINEVLLEECWDGAATISFADATPDIPGNYEDGTADACRPELLEVDLVPPEFVVPEGDPQIPGVHPDEE